MRVGWESRPPYQYLENRGHVEYLTGVDIELVRRITELGGNRVSFEEHDWATSLEKVRAGEIEVVLSAFFDEEREQYAWFSEPYRLERQVLFFNPTDPPAFSASSSMEFVEQVHSHSFRLGIVDGYFYGPVVTDALNSKRYAPLVSKAGSESELLELMLNGRIDGFVSDRLAGQRAINQLGVTGRVREHSFVLYESGVHAMFSRASSKPEHVAAFNQGLAELRSSGEYESILRRFTAPVLLSIAVSGNWFFILDIIGTIAFAISGVLIARKENYSLLGAFILASLPAVGGGVVRDLLIGRDPIGILETPLYMTLVLGTVLTGYLLNWLLKFVRGRFLWVFDISIWIVNMSRYVLPRNVFEVFDAIGLASFTVTGVAVASKYGAEPLWLWGPLLAAITAAGGGILRDVFRADAHNPTLKTSFYAEIAVCWGLALSVFLYFGVLDVGAETVRTAVIVTVVGAFVSRFAVVMTGLRSPQF